MRKIRIVVVEDMEIVRKGFKALLAASPGIEVCGEAGDGLEAIEKARTLDPDVMLMDLTMPKMDGPQAIAVIKKEKPGISILALTVHKEERYLISALTAGADGYVLKDVSEEELIRAMDVVVEGGKHVSSEVSNFMINGYLSSKKEADGQEAAKQEDAKQEDDSPLALLSKRELEVVALLAEGNSYKEIAKKLFISAKTVDAHIVKMKKKLKAKSSAILIVFAAKAGLVDAG